MPPEVARAFRTAGLSRRQFLRIGGAGVAGAALLGVAGCGTFDGGGGGGGGVKVLDRNIGAEIDDLDSAVATDEVSFEIILNTREGLHRLDGEEKPQLAMAEKVAVSEDELTFTFTLREGATWSNGDPVTSGHFKFAWLKAMDPTTASQYSFILADYIQGGNAFNSGEAGPEQVAIETPDDRTLVVTLAAPTPYFLSMTAFPTYMPQNQAFVEEQGDQYALGAANLLFNGPYTITAYDPASGGMLEKNDAYWDKANVDIESIRMRIVKDLNTSLRLYQSGELDLTELSGEQVARFRQDPEFFRFIGFTNFYGQMNLQNPVMANLNIRKALMLGFDRLALAEQVLQDGSEPAYALVPPGMAGPEDQTFREANGPQIPTDPTRAAEFWQQGVQELGSPPEITMLFTDSSTARAIATFIQGQYRQILGIEAAIDITTFEDALDRMDNRDYQISFASGWGADYNDPYTFMQLFLSDSGFNRSSWSNPRYDQLVNGARTEPDDLKRMQMMLEAEQILFSEAVMVPEYYEAVVGLIKPYLTNYVSHPYGAEPDWKYARLEGKDEGA